MASLPENATYGNPPTNPLVPGGFKYTPTTGGAQLPAPASGFRYTPNQNWQYLAQLKSRGRTGQAQLTPPDPSTIQPGTPEYDTSRNAAILQYGSLLNKGQGVPTETSFLPPTDPNAPIPVPSDYGTFMPNTTIENQQGEKLSWGTPMTPVIKNIQGDVPGQYVEDTSNPNLLVKTQRGSNSIADQAIHDGRPGFMYQIDHIMPLELGGADTLANRELLTSDQNDAKTKAQAVPYTLYAHGQLSLSQARDMAMKWKNKDLTDLPEPNGIGLIPDQGGKTGLQIAQEVAQRWTQPAKPTLKDMIGQIPQGMKDLGKGFIPDPIREFVKGALSGATLGFLPYQQGDNEDLTSKIAGIAGAAAGGLGSFILGGELIDGALALGGLAAGAFDAYRGVATAEAVASGLGGAEAAAAVAEGAGETANALEGAKVAETTFKSLNKAPGYLKTLLSPETMGRAVKFGATSVLVGQGQQFVANKFNPYTLSGKGLEKNQGVAGTIGNVMKDFAMGAATGVMPPTLKGTAYAVALPMTLSFIANPDDPTTAITNGVIFGAMHGIGTFGTPGYNNVEMLGGKPFENPLIKSFEQTANKAAYASLSHYAPDVYPALGQGEIVPETAHDIATVQKAKDVAIENVWQRFFFGKDATPAIKDKALSDFKSFSQSIEKPLDAEKPEVTGLDKLSMAKRRAANTELKTQNADIKSTFGKGYQTQNVAPGDTASLPDEGMDLQTALTEIKRITAASRQLYKGGLATDARNMADVNDLLSFGKAQLQGRFDAQEKFLNPPIAKQAVDSIDDSFMQNSFNNSNGQAPSGKYPTGDAALTGAGLEINKNVAKWFIQQKDAGNASPNILLVDRSDTSPLWSMKNQLIESKDIAAKRFAMDPNPQHALQAFGVTKDPQTGAKSLVPLGWMASDFRLNEQEAPNARAFNKHPAVLKYGETGGAEGLKPLDLNKDQIAAAMKKEGISVLVANLDPRYTAATVETGNPFIPVNFNDQNWEYSKALGTRLSQQTNTDPISMSVSKVANAINARAKTDAIKEMNQKVVRPASDYIPKPINTPKAGVTDTASVPRETTRGLLQTMEKSLDVANPTQLKASFQKNLGILLPDEQAQQIFDNRNDITMRDGVKMLVDAVNSGNADAATKVKLQFAKTYLESGILQSTDGGKALPDMKLLGEMKSSVGSYKQQPSSEGSMSREPVTRVTSQDVKPAIPVRGVEPTQSTVQDVTNNNIPINTPEKTEDVSKPIETQTPIPVPTEPVSGSSMAEKIITNAKKVFPQANKPLLTPETTQTAYELAKSYIPAGLAKLEDAKVGGPGYTSATEESIKGAVSKEASVHDSIITGIEKQIQTDLQGRNVSANIINEVKSQVRTALEGQSEFILGPDASSGFGQNIPIPKPTVRTAEFYKFIDQGLAKTEDPPAHYFAKTFDTVFKSLFGDRYKNKIELAKVLSTMTKEGSGFWNDIFFNDTNAAGREIQQNKDIINARASGDRNAEMQAYADRRQQLADNPVGTGGSLTKEQMAKLGIEGNQISKESGAGMRVIPWYQDENMVGDLTQGENLMAGAVSGQPLSAASAVRDVKRIFIGAGKDSPGLLQYMNNLREESKPGSKKLSIPSSVFDNLEKEAKTVDAQKALKENTSKANLEEANQQLPILQEAIKNMMTRIKSDEPPATWETPEVIQGTIDDIMTKMEKFNKIIEDAKKGKKGGKGGPGSHDGTGGPGIGGFFGAIWDKLKNGNTYTWQNPDVNKPSPSIDTQKFLNAIAQNETSVINGDPYKSWQPSGNKKLGRALGKYRVTEGSLKEHAPDYLGHSVTSQQFLASPSLQDKYMTNMATTLNGQGYTPQQIADIHRSGTTLETGYRDPGYVNKFNSSYNLPAAPKPPGALVDLGK